jgi:hypothetical protein
LRIDAVPLLIIDFSDLPLANDDDDALTRVDDVINFDGTFKRETLLLGVTVRFGNCELVCEPALDT